MGLEVLRAWHRWNLLRLVSYRPKNGINLERRQTRKWRYCYSFCRVVRIVVRGQEYFFYKCKDSESYAMHAEDFQA